MRRSKAAYVNYVCPRCYHQLQECTCDYFPPWELIMVDEKIQDCVRILNEKGYTTSGSCEGHYEQGPGTNTGLCFIMTFEDLVESELPDGFKWIKHKTCLVYYYKTITDKASFRIEQKKALDSLLEWCAKLPVMRHAARRYRDCPSPSIG